MARINKRFCWNCGCEVPYIIYKNMSEIPKCSNCGVLYPEKKKLEAELTLKQDKYLKTRSKKDMEDLFADIPKLTFNLICKVLKKQQIVLEPEIIWDKANWTVMTLISYYKNKPNFKIEGSFVGYISQMILYPIFNQNEIKKNKTEISIENTVGNNNSNDSKTIEDFICSNTMNIDYSSDVEKDILAEEKKKELPIIITNFISEFLNKAYKDNIINLNETYELYVLFDLFVKRRTLTYFNEAFKSSKPKIQDIWEKMISVLCEKLREGNTDE